MERARVITLARFLMMNDEQITELLNVAQEAAYVAGAYLNERRGAKRTRHSKGFRDWVTDDDFATQALITDLIRAQFPDHGFLTEEDDDSLPAAGTIRWLVDPIDGTSNYSRRVPLISISVAAVREDRVLAAVTYDPNRDEIFAAADGHRATLNGEPMSVSDLREPADAFVALDWSHAEERRAATVGQLERIAPHVHTLRAIGSAALAQAWVAAGRFDVYLNASLKPWDVAAGALLLQEAGGRLTDWQNQPWQPDAHREACLASNGHLHEWLLSRF
jgi:myo-inositol-1(or 4)-monophosphatase